MLHFAIKTEITDLTAEAFVFAEHKTMYGGLNIAAGDQIFIFATGISENAGHAGLLANGVVIAVQAVPKKIGIARQTPRVSITVKRNALAKSPIGRNELKAFTNWHDGRPETELNFKFYRQATNKIVGISAATADYLLQFF